MSCLMIKVNAIDDKLLRMDGLMDNAISRVAFPTEKPSDTGQK